MGELIDSVFGVSIENNITAVRFWSPEAQSVELVLSDSSVPLQKNDDGVWHVSTKELPEGSRYRFRVDGNEAIPDPASFYQPEGVHGPSEVINLKTFEWTDDGWRNPDLEKYIIYELHTGTFSEKGNFKGVEEKLDHLVSLGITAIEIMPVAQFPGERNWGYDGVFPYAVQNSYGGPRGLQNLVNQAHNKGLAVILDVVYNHMGPEGNYLTAAAPFFTEKYKTPWGSAINFDDAYSDGVRNYFTNNVMMWFRDFHVDALRMDAVHAIKDFSARHILEDIRKATDTLIQKTGKNYYLIVESDLNDTRFIDPVSKRGFGMDAQWVDEFHHALRVTATGEKTGYYSDFNGLEHLAKSYRDAYVYDGQYSPHRKKIFGVPATNPGKQFIVFSQNHDQVGNRMLGERVGIVAGFEMQKLMAAAVMVSPFLPMLFMGEEWHEPNPFLYFVSHTDKELAEAVRKGRKEEFSAFHDQGEAPDPNAIETFAGSRLQWKLINQHPYSVMLDYYKNLILLRKSQPALFRLERNQLHVDTVPEKNLLILHRWADDQELVCFMNFSSKAQDLTPPSSIHGWQKLLDSADTRWNGPMNSNQSMHAGMPGSSPIALQPQSILIYTNIKK